MTSFQSRNSFSALENGWTTQQSRRNKRRSKGRKVEPREPPVQQKYVQPEPPVQPVQPVQTVPHATPRKEDPEELLEKVVESFQGQFSREDVVRVLGGRELSIENTKLVVKELQTIQARREAARFEPDEPEELSEQVRPGLEEKAASSEPEEIIEEPESHEVAPVEPERIEYETRPQPELELESTRTEPEPVISPMNHMERLKLEAKQLDLMSENSKGLLRDWAAKIAESEDYRKAFNQSPVLKCIITSLLEVNFINEIPCRNEVEELFHLVLQGNEEYHAWLFGQLRKLAEYITKTSPPSLTGQPTEFQKFLARQAFDIVNAHKKENDHPNSNLVPPQARPAPPTRQIGQIADEKMEIYLNEADRQCNEMWATYEELSIKDAALRSMNPTSNQSFTERYGMVRKQLETKLQKTATEIQVHDTKLRSINQRWANIENTMKESVLPIEQELQDISHKKLSTQEEIAQLENKLALRKEELEKLTAREQKLSNKIVLVKTDYAPESKSLNQERSDVQFKLYAVYRQRNCFTHLDHITTESYKHLESWSRNNISKEKEGRSKLLAAYFKKVESYVFQQFKMLNLLERRLKFMTKRKEQLNEELKDMKTMFGGRRQQETMNDINKNKADMEKDKSSIHYFGNEIKETLHKAQCAAFVPGAMGGVQDPKLFHELYHSLQSKIAQFDTELSHFISLPKYNIPGVAQAPMEPARANQPLQIIHNQPSLKLANQSAHYAAGHVGQMDGDQRAATTLQQVQPRKPPVTAGHQYMQLGAEQNFPYGASATQEAISQPQVLDRQQHEVVRSPQETTAPLHAVHQQLHPSEAYAKPAKIEASGNTGYDAPQMQTSAWAQPDHTLAKIAQNKIAQNGRVEQGPRGNGRRQSEGRRRGARATRGFRK